MNVRERVEKEKKKNKYYLSLPGYPLNRSCPSRKIPIEKEKEKKKKNTDRKQPN